MSDYTVNALSLLCLLPITGSLTNPYSRIGNESAFLKYLGMVDGVITDFLHGRYVPKTNIEIQGNFSQYLVHERAYTKIDCMERCIPFREGHIYRKDISTSTGRKIAPMIKTITQKFPDSLAQQPTPLKWTEM